MMSTAGKSSGIGGQAVLEGIMMKNQDVYSVGVRKPDGEIEVHLSTHEGIGSKRLRKIPIISGVISFVDSLVLGMKCLTFSASFYDEEEAQPSKADTVVQKLFGERAEKVVMGITVAFSIVMAVAIFMVLPYFAAALLRNVIVSDTVLAVIEGAIRLLLFIGYVLLISLMKDIQRVFQYHGAEHKTLAAFESGGVVSADTARRFSRLHPRCGTTFLLFVLVVAVLAHTVLVPALLLVWTPESFWLKHALTVLFKLALLVPISCLSYEIILYAARMGDGVCGRCLRAPGLLLQRLTTREPYRTQLEVAIAALAAVLGPEAGDRLVVPPDVIHVPLLPRS